MDQKIIDQINAMDQHEMASLWRNAPAGSVYFREPYYTAFKARFDSLGGMTPAVSKAVGWEG